MYISIAIIDADIEKEKVYYFRVTRHEKEEEVECLLLEEVKNLKRDG